MTNINAFSMETVQGASDLSFHGSVITCQIDAAEGATMVAGEAVLVTDNAGGVPKVEQLGADTDGTFGFIVRNMKDASFSAGDRCEVAMQGSVLYMTAGAAIARGAQVEYDVSAIKVITAAGTNPVVGWALDKATADGGLVRVFITTPVAAA